MMRLMPTTTTTSTLAAVLLRGGGFRAARTTTTRTTTVVLRHRRDHRRFKSIVAEPKQSQQSPTATTTTAAEAASEESASASASPDDVVARSLIAALIGVGTVSAAAAAVENATASSVPTYTRNGQRFDQSTFGGRFCKMILACDPWLLLYSTSRVRKAQNLLALEHAGYVLNISENHGMYRNKDRSVVDRALWEAKRITEAALHPDTGEVIPRPFRMSGYVPFNGPICVAMVSSPSTAALLFWSWVNQSQNALVNYYNRNASSPMTNTTLGVSYGAAVGSALAVAFGLATFIQKKYSPTEAKRLLRFVAFPSAVVASSLNCFIVRAPEMSTGVPLLDEPGGRDVLPGQTSKEAAKLGVYSTTASRALLQAPVYFLPPVLLSTVGPLKRYLSKSPHMVVPVTTYLLLVSFGVGLPATVAIFPQFSSVQAASVESEFQHLVDPKTNRPYETYYYNKGL